MQDQGIDQKIHDQIVKRLEHTDIPHVPAAIAFCGIPGSGKTSLAQRLARDLQAQYVQNDALRLIANQQLGIAKFDAHPVGRQIMKTIVTDHANKLIVFDASIDRTWREFLDFCQEIAITPIIVRITINPEEAIARMQKRSRHDDADLIEGTYRRLAQFEACKRELPADVEVTSPFDYQVVLDAIQRKLTQL